MSVWKDGYKEWVVKLSKYPLLNMMYYSRVFSIGELVNGQFEIIEECDQSHSVRLNKVELKQLADEIYRFVEE
jgi:hypothetical protein